ncbi:MAG TPA: hypothetical protein VIV40_44240 [Kofleriaceae bacterium]
MAKKITKGHVYQHTPEDKKTVKVTIATGGEQPALWAVFLDGETVKKGTNTPKTISIGKGAELHGKSIEVKIVTFDHDDSSDLISASIDIEGVDEPETCSEQFDSEPDAWLSLNALYFLA